MNGRREARHVTYLQKALDVRKRKQRTCLRCFHQFLSLGPWNRICPKCRRVNEEILMGNCHVTRPYHNRPFRDYGE